MNKESMKIGEFVAVYTDIESDRFGFGKVIAISEKHALIANVEPNGVESG